MSESVQTTERQEPSAGTISAVDAAVISDDPSAYKAARNAEKAGTPLPAVAKPGVLEEDEYQRLRSRQAAGDFLTDLERQSLRRTSRARQQEKVNEGARRAAQKVVEDFDGQIKAKDAEIEQLRRDLATASAPRVPAQVEAASTGRPVAVPIAKPAPVAAENPAPDVNDATKYPAGVYDPQYIEDRTLYRLRAERAEEDKTTREMQQREADKRAWTDARVRFSQTMEAAQTDPDYEAVKTGDIAAKRLIPVEAFRELQAANVLPKDAEPSPENFLASYIVGQSPIPYELLKYFHQHPDVYTRVLAEGPQAVYRLEGQLLAGRASATPPPVAAASSSTRASSPAKKTITDATPPVTALGTREAAPTDPKEAAITASAGDLHAGTRDYLAERRREMAAAAPRRR